jgi:predicted deacylase
MEVITVGSAHADGPGRFEGGLKVGAMPDGAPIEIPVVIVRGKEPGPVMWMHGCVHGNEYCGTFSIHTFMRSLDPATMQGTVIGLPILNLPAFRARQRMSPFEGFNNGDLNRCFPGNPGGGFSEQMAYHIYKPLKQYATHLVDFHTAFTIDTRWALYAEGPGDVGKVGRQMAEAFGYENTLPTPAGTLVGSAMMTASADGIPSFIVEAGGIVDTFTREIVDDVAERLRNIARSIGILPGEVTKYGPLTIFSNFHWCNAPRGGLFKPAVKAGQPITEGDLVGTFYNTSGDTIGEARAPATGIVLAYHPGPLLPQGDTLIHIGLNPRQA